VKQHPALDLRSDQNCQRDGASNFWNHLVSNFSRFRIFWTLHEILCAQLLPDRCSDLFDVRLKWMLLLFLKWTHFTLLPDFRRTQICHPGSERPKLRGRRVYESSWHGHFFAFSNENFKQSFEILNILKKDPFHIFVQLKTYSDLRSRFRKTKIEGSVCVWRFLTWPFFGISWHVATSRGTWRCQICTFCLCKRSIHLE